jgi:hypothetical protein
MAKTPHDALFKSTFSQVEHAAGELRRMLPPRLLERMDFSTLTLCPGSFLDEALKERSTDLLFSVAIAGREAFVYLLFEHQSTVEPRMAFRLLRYMVRIWESWLVDHPEALRIPAIVPIVLHHSETGWTAETAFEALLDVDPEMLAEILEHVPRFRFLLDDVSAESDEALRARAMTALGRLVLWCLRNARTPEKIVAGIGGWVGLIREARRAPNGPAALRLVWRYIFAIDKQRRPEELLAQLTEAVGEEGKEDLVTVADLLREEGRKEGLNEGRREGLQEGQRTTLLKTLLKLLGARFGALPEPAVAQIQAAGQAQLDAWLDLVLTAPALADVLNRREGEG